MTTRRSVAILLWLFCVGCSVLFCQSYRVGDAIDTFVRTESIEEDALRSQMPSFGIPSKSAFRRSQRFSLSFEEGLRPLPWVPTVDSEGRFLESLELTFVYSKSGGMIHSVSSRPNYETRDDNVRSFTVLYNWVEEEEVDPKASMALLFLVTLVATAFLVLQSCLSTFGEDSSQPSPNKEHHSTAIPSGGKWD